jgi:hypothetical protein
MSQHQGLGKIIGVGGFRLERRLPAGTYVITDVARGIEDSPAVRQMFPVESDRDIVLGRTMVSIAPGPGYMRVDSDGTILVAQDHLRFSDERVVYMDFVHELVHVKQAMDGRSLYGGNLRYVDKETEIEAYTVAVNEGRRIGMTEEELQDYLEVPWITGEEFQRLLARMGVAQKQTP